MSEAGHVYIETNERWRPVVHGDGLARKLAEEKLAELVPFLEEWLPAYPSPWVMAGVYADIATQANEQAKREAT
jgi:hypothetical protein